MLRFVLVCFLALSVSQNAFSQYSDIAILQAKQREYDKHLNFKDKLLSFIKSREDYEQHDEELLRVLSEIKRRLVSTDGKDLTKFTDLLNSCAGDYQTAIAKFELRQQKQTNKSIEFDLGNDLYEYLKYPQLHVKKKILIPKTLVMKVYLENYEKNQFSDVCQLMPGWTLGFIGNVTLNNRAMCMVFCEENNKVGFVSKRFLELIAP
jgi:hypothetical protein